MRYAALVSSIVAASSVAFAHDGPRVWVGSENGTITTYTSDNDEAPTTYSPAQVFLSTFDDLEGVFTTEFPGFELRRDGQHPISNGTIVSFNIAGPLLKLDVANNRLSSTQELFGNPGPVPELGVSLNPNARVTNASIVEGFPFFQSFPGNHGHLSFTLLGDGVNPAGGPDGVYVLPMLLTAPSLARSDWFFITLQKNNTAAERTQALALAQNMADALPGDANFDGTVNINDFAILAANFNTTNRWWRFGDFDFNGTVNISDFALLAGNFNQSSPRAAIPEPAGAVAVAGLLFCSWRKRRVVQR